MNNDRLFHSPRKHLLIIEKPTYDNFLEIIKEFEIYPMSEVIVASFCNSSYAELIQPYKIGKEDDLSKSRK